MEFVFGTDIEFSFSSIPTDMDSSEQWDLYWSCKACTPKPSDLETNCKVEWLEQFRKREARTILFVGNGFSQEPQFFAYAGFQSVAMDLSPTATRYASTVSWTERALLSSFGVSEDEKDSFLRKMYRFGGSARYEIGSLFTSKDCAGPHDIIIVRRTLQLFEGSKLDQAIICLEKRLAKGGLLFVEISESQSALTEFKQSLERCKWSLHGHHPEQKRVEILFSPEL